jgi:AcrR family transcriptional regulator
MSSAPQSPPPRSTYRHGDLRRALLEAGVELARAGGPEAVVLREATRRAGVAPNAAYRHFDSRQALLYAVRSAALAAVARAMEAELAALPQDLPPAEFARANVRAVGAGYLRFAQAESGLFRTAFGPSDDMQQRAQGAPADPSAKAKAGWTRSSCWARRSTNS